MVLKAHNLPIIVLGGWGAESLQVANNRIGRVPVLKAHKLPIIMLRGWCAESLQVANNHVGRVWC
jgi:hypothetical protein